MYCGGPGPFTREHMVPASIGGDDRSWMLTDCVCGGCNTGVFSPLELKFARSSPFYLSRLYLQPTTRKQGRKTEPPKAQPADSLYFDPDSNLIAEGTIEAGLVPACLPQIHLRRGPTGQGIAFTVLCADAPALAAFLAAVSAVLGDRCVVVEKNAAGFTAHELMWQVDRYQVASSAAQSTVPKGAVWYASLEPVAQYARQMQAALTGRLFRHPSGSLTCRATDIFGVAALLSAVRVEGPTYGLEAAGARAASIARPAFRQSVVIDFEAQWRVLAKIGMNVIAFTHGANTVREPSFERARHYVLGQGRRLVVKMRGDDEIPISLQPFAQSRHIIGITVERRLGMEVVRGIFRLYGGPVQRVRLAARCGRSTGIKPVWISVDYVNHKIERH